MVGAVEGSAGSTAYLKGAQLGSSSSAARKPAAEQTQKETETPSTSFVRETEATSSKRVEEPKDDKPVDTTELQSKNDEATLRTEQTRGSLLDIAV